MVIEWYAGKVVGKVESNSNDINGLVTLTSRYHKENKAALDKLGSKYEKHSDLEGHPILSSRLDATIAQQSKNEADYEELNKTIHKAQIDISAIAQAVRHRDGQPLLKTISTDSN